MTTNALLTGAWNWEPGVLIGCACLLLVYIAAANVGFSRHSLAGFAGVLLLFIILVSPIKVLADRYLFSIHMAKHILFVLVIPALLLIGMPAPFVQRALRQHPLGRLEHLLRNPVLAWTAGIGSMVFWHIPAICNAAMPDQPLHVVEQCSLLFGGTIYWWPLLSPVRENRLTPVPQAATYLFTSCAACTGMGILITFAPHLLYTPYVQPPHSSVVELIRNQWGISAAMDQQIGGLIMWVPGCLVYLTAIMAMFARWYDEEPAGVAET